MIKITIRDDGVHCIGHACEPGDNNKDDGHRVCAAVSALTQMLGDGCRRFSSGEVSERCDSGDIDIIWGDMTERVAIVVETYAMGVKGVAASSDGRAVVEDLRGTH